MEIERELDKGELDRLMQISRDISNELGVSTGTVMSVFRQGYNEEEVREMIKQYNIVLLGDHLAKRKRGNDMRYDVDHRIETVKYHKCSDGTIYMKYEEAKAHEKNLMAINKLEDFVIEKAFNFDDADVIQSFIKENAEDLHTLLSMVLKKI